MRRLVCLLVLLPVAALADGIALQVAKLHTVSELGTLENVTVLVRDGRIEAVGADVQVPDGYAVVDASNRVVTPGLVDAHTQFGLQEIAGEVSTRDDFVREYPMGPSLDVADALADTSTLYAVNRRDGVTRAVVAPSPGNDPLAGWGALIRLSEMDQLLDTRVAMFGSIANAEFNGGSRAAVLQRLRDALHGARRSAKSSDEREYRRSDREALQALVKSTAPLVLEVHRAADIRRAIDLAETVRLRLVILGGTEAWKVADELAAADVPVILDVIANLPSNFDRLGARLDSAALLHAAGVRVMLSSEQTHNARWMRQLAGNAVAHGMPWDAALASITAQPARTFGFANGVGQVVRGGVADLVVWSGDPLEVTTWAERVMIDGQWQPMNSRQTRLFERYKNLEDQSKPFSYR